MSNETNMGIETPCIQLCVADLDTGLCLGCGRSREEVGGWLRMPAQNRREIMDELPDRLSKLTRSRRRKGGARSRRQSLALG